MSPRNGLGPRDLLLAQLKDSIDGSGRADSGDRADPLQGSLAKVGVPHTSGESDSEGQDVLRIQWGVWDQMIREEEQRNGKLWQQASMRSAVAAALGLNIFNRQADKLYMCNIAQLMNVLQSVLLTDGPEGKNCVRTTNYWAFMLFKPHRGKTAVRVETDGPKLADLGWRGGRGAQPDPPPDLSLSATRKVSEMVVTLVNAAAR